MLNSVGLQGPGVEAWVAHELPELVTAGRASWPASGVGASRTTPERRPCSPAPPAWWRWRSNVSCPNLEDRSRMFAHSARADGGRRGRFGGVRCAALGEAQPERRGPGGYRRRRARCRCRGARPREHRARHGHRHAATDLPPRLGPRRRRAVGPGHAPRRRARRARLSGRVPRRRCRGRRGSDTWCRRRGADARGGRRRRGRHGDISRSARSRSGARRCGAVVPLPRRGRRRTLVGAVHGSGGGRRPGPVRRTPPTHRPWSAHRAPSAHRRAWWPHRTRPTRTTRSCRRTESSPRARREGADDHGGTKR